MELRLEGLVLPPYLLNFIDVAFGEVGEVRDLHPQCGDRGVVSNEDLWWINLFPIHASGVDHVCMR